MSLVGLLRLVLAAVLLAAAGSKLAAGRRGRDALRSYGLDSAGARAAAWGAAIALEAVVAAAVLVDERAAFAAAALLALFAAAQAVAIGRGRAGAPCGCFGARGRLSGWSVARTAVLAAAFAALPFLPNATPSTQAWLAAGLAVALAGVAALAVALLALARELGELRLTIAPQAALSLEHEGPEVGGRVPLAERFETEAPLKVAVFSSRTCSLCAALEPSLRLLANDPELELRVFDEHDDADAWAALAVPGSPYAVVLAGDGEVLAKGTFNSLLQLEGLVAARA